VYNVDSRDEISNIDLARKLLGMFSIHETDPWIQWTRDRPFNDRRYAVDGSKLRKLGWSQSTSFDDGVAATVDWYAKFSAWWGPVDNTLLAPFPVVRDGLVVQPEASRMSESESETWAGASNELSNGVGMDHQNGQSKKRKAEHMA
jgi:hypothetical protein